MLITTAQAKTHLGVSGSDDDAVIEALAQAAQDAMSLAAGRALEGSSRTETVNGTGRATLWLAEPARSITSVYVSSDQEWTASNLVDSDDYHVDECRLERLDGSWTRGQYNVRVTYATGLAAADLYAAQQACRMQVGAWYAEWQRTKAGLDLVESEQQNEWTRSFLPRAALEPATLGVCESLRPGRL